MSRLHSHKPPRTFRQNSAINVTPLVDVTLVLLIIFMVTAPMMTVGVKVDLPQTNASQLNDSADPLIVSIKANGNLYIQEAAIEFQDLIPKLSAIIGTNKDLCVYIQADQSLPYSTVMSVMGAIAESGIAKVSLIAEMPTKKSPNKKRN